MSLRALAFGELGPGQARAYRASAAPAMALPGAATQAEALPTEGALPGVPSPENLSPTSLGLLAAGGTGAGAVPYGVSDQPGAAGGAPSDLPTGASDTPIGPIAELPGFKDVTTSPEVTETAGAAPTSQLSTANQGLPQQGFGEAPVSDNPLGQGLTRGLQILSSPRVTNLLTSPSDVSRGTTGGASLSDALRSGAGAASSALTPAGMVPFTTGTALQSGNVLGGVPAAVGGTPLSFEDLVGAGGFGLEGGSPVPLPQSFGAAAGGLSSLGGSFGAGSAAAQAAAEHALASGAAEGAASTFASEAAPAVSGLAASWPMAIPGAVITGLSLINSIADMLHPQRPLHETQSIRRDFGPAWSAMGQAGNNLQRLADTTAGSPDEAQTLRDVLYNANYQLAQGPAISQYISTEGGKKTGPLLHIPPVDISGITPYSGMLTRDATLAYTNALDRLANMGQTPEFGPGPGQLNISDMWANPRPLLSAIAESGGVNLDQYNPSLAEQGQPTMYRDELGNYTIPPPTALDYRKQPYELTPEEAASFGVPGHRMEALGQLFSKLNPDFWSTQLGGNLTTLGYGPPQPRAAAPAAAPLAAAPPSRFAGLSDLALSPVALALAQKQKEEET